MQTWTIQKLLNWITEHFTKKGIDSPRLSAELLLSRVLVAIVKKELKIELNLGEILQIFSIVLFEKVSITQVLTKTMSQNKINQFHNQLLLFDL